MALEKKVAKCISAWGHRSRLINKTKRKQGGRLRATSLLAIN